jgi:Transposase, Mutator family
MAATSGRPCAEPAAAWSTNALERLNREVGAVARWSASFTTGLALLRLVGAILEEQNDEWAVGRRYFDQESMHKLLDQVRRMVGQDTARRFCTTSRNVTKPYNAGLTGPADAAYGCAGRSRKPSDAWRAN